MFKKKKNKEVVSNAKDERPIKYIKKSKKLVKYRYLFVLLTFCLSVLIAMFIFKVNVFWIYLWLVVTAILMFNALILFFLNILLDWRNIQHKIITLKKGSYFIDIMKCKDGKTRIMYLPITKKPEFEWNEGTYILDPQAMTSDDNNVPVVEHVEGVPNPCIYNYEKYINEYYDKKKADPKARVFDWKNRLIDVAYSSMTLRDMKKDKFFSEFHSDKFAEANKVVVMLIISGIVMMVSFTLIMLFVASGK